MPEVTEEQVIYKSKSGKEIHVGDTVMIPFRVTKLAGAASQLVHVETVEAYGHINATAKDANRGRTRTGIWVEPEQIEIT